MRVFVSLPFKYYSVVPDIERVRTDVLLIRDQMLSYYQPILISEEPLIPAYAETEKNVFLMAFS